MDVFVKIEKVKSLNDVIKLRKLFDTVEMSFRNLTELGVETATYGILIINILFDYLPEGLKIIISREYKESEWTLDNIMKVFKNELNARERCQLLGKTSSNGQGNRTQPQSTFNGNTQHSKVCVYCKANHPSSKCNKVTDIHARTNILRISARCLLCLQQGHKQSKCESNYKCNKCER